MVSSQSKLIEYIDFLQKIALNSDISYKHAAALIDNSKIYSYSFNTHVKKLYLKSKQTNKIETHFKTIHAEINIFSNFPKKMLKI